MLLGTHCLLPVCLCLGVENVSLARGRDYVFPEWTLPVVALFGALPDICSPHLSLEDRHTSWSHTVFFLGGLIPIAAMVAVLYPAYGPPRWRTAVACWLAAALHLAADSVSGGVAWFYPWKPDVLGDYYVPVLHWPWWDAGFILLTWFLLRLRPRAAARGIRRRG